ncbi:hypothetical protein B0H34DRAFT_858980 [Crassisporium funariophilum]|nr:hypothetical protein B0H34DRAFT_858980 [Crassisporium funariophilum]
MMSSVRGGLLITWGSNLNLKGSSSSKLHLDQHHHPPSGTPSNAANNNCQAHPTANYSDNANDAGANNHATSQ